MLLFRLFVDLLVVVPWLGCLVAPEGEEALQVTKIAEPRLELVDDRVEEAMRPRWTALYSENMQYPAEGPESGVIFRIVGHGKKRFPEGTFFLRVDMGGRHRANRKRAFRWIRQAWPSLEASQARVSLLLLDRL